MCNFTFISNGYGPINAHIPLLISYMNSSLVSPVFLNKSIIQAPSHYARLQQLIDLGILLHSYFFILLNTLFTIRARIVSSDDLCLICCEYIKEIMNNIGDDKVRLPERNYIKQSLR